MKQSRAEQILKEELTKKGVVGVYNTALESKEGANVLLKILHRNTSIPKYQIANYLNNRKGFSYDHQAIPQD